MDSKLIVRTSLAIGSLALAAGLSASASTGAVLPAHSIAHVPACANGQVDSWLATEGNAALGTTYFQLQFTNLATHSCSLTGFPGVSAVNVAGRQIGGAAGRSGPRRSVVLGGGGTARAALGIVVTGNFSAGSCRPKEAFGLRVYAPNQTASDVIPFPFSVCAVATTASINVATVTR